MTYKNVEVANKDSQYSKLGITPGVINKFEDGQRTSGEKRTFEWWYFDSHHEDGSKVVVVFFTKPYTEIVKPLSPRVQVQYVDSKGNTTQELLDFDASEYSSSKNTCDVKIGNNTFRGDNSNYKIYVKGKKIELTIDFKKAVESWRLHTGHILYGEKQTDYWAWLPVVPDAIVSTKVTINNETKIVKGSGYHDHNWGNISMLKIMHHWHWARTKIGDYNIISAYIISEKKYNYKPIPVFMIAKNGKIIADSADKFLKYTEMDKYIDPLTNKPLYNEIIYDYNDTENNIRYKITYKRKGDVLKRVFINEINNKVKKVLAKLIGFDGAYIRYYGNATIEKFENEKRIEKISAPAFGEFMMFGKNIKQ